MGCQFEGFVADRAENIIRGDWPPLGEPIAVLKLQVDDYPDVIEQLREVEVERSHRLSMTSLAGRTCA